MVIEVKQGDKFVKIPYITADIPVKEAPIDGKQYARQDGGWSEVKTIDVPDVQIVNIPIDVFSLRWNSTSDKIFQAFGGKQNLFDIVLKVTSGRPTVFLVASPYVNDDPVLTTCEYFTVQHINAVYTDSDNFSLSMIIDTSTISRTYTESVHFDIMVDRGSASVYAASQYSPIFDEITYDQNEEKEYIVKYKDSIGASFVPLTDYVPKQKVLSQTAYDALGAIVNTDNILYFITE